MNHDSQMVKFLLLLLFIAKPEKSEPSLLSTVHISSQNQLPVLYCNFTGRPKVNVTWHYSDQIKGFNDSVHHGTSELIWTAGFFNITYVPKICKTYAISCSGENEFGKAEQTTVLNVTGE